MIYEPDALIMAPLSGFTDAPYRRSARRCGCRYAFTEMVDAASLTFAFERSKDLLLRYDDEEFLGVQLLGGNADHIKEAVEKLNAFHFDVLDFNLGCPVPKVTKKCAGAELGLHYDEAVRCFDTVARYSKFPVSAKLRILDTEDPEPTLKLCRGLVNCGAQALTVHGRVRKAFYSGTVHHHIIKAVRESFPEIEVIANGGVNSVESYGKMKEMTGCTRVMLATGIMGNPWLFRQLKDPGNFTPPSFQEWRSIIEEQSRGMVELYGPECAYRHARKIYHDYLKGRGFNGSLRAVASGTSSESDLKAWLDMAEQSGVMRDEKI
jgi:nifR3 family TIM-barrel protein